MAQGKQYTKSLHGRTTCNPHGRMNRQNLMLAFDDFDNDKMGVGVINRMVYEYMWQCFGENISINDAQSILPQVSTDNWGIFNVLYMDLGKRYEHSLERKRLEASKHSRLRNKQINLTEDGSVNTHNLTKKLREQKYKCVLCGAYIKERDTRQLDHIKPISKFGTHTLDNVQWLCIKCNQKKRDYYEG